MPSTGPTGPLGAFRADKEASVGFFSQAGSHVGAACTRTQDSRATGSHQTKAKHLERLYLSWGSWKSHRHASGSSISDSKSNNDNNKGNDNQNLWSPKNILYAVLSTL